MRSRIWEKNALKNPYAGACPYRKTADTFAGLALAILMFHLSNHLLAAAAWTLVLRL
jgi:hypothetical protein